MVWHGVAWDGKGWYRVVWGGMKWDGIDWLMVMWSSRDIIPFKGLNV